MQKYEYTLRSRRARGRDRTPYFFIPCCFLMVLTVMAVFTGQWAWKPNFYNSYTLQCLSWLEGRLDLGQDYPWLELAIYEGKYFVSFPPFPSYVLLPFAALMGTNTPDGWIALTCAVLSGIYAARLYRLTKAEERYLPLYTLFLLCGNGYLFLTLNGYVWFIAQNMCFTLSLMAIVYAMEHKGGRSLACWAAAVGCRPMTAIYFPVLAYLLWQARPADTGDSPKAFLRWVLRHLHWAIGPLVLGGSYMVLNWLRFGSVTEFGHNYLPEFTRIATGQFSLTYFMGNLKELLRLPDWTGNALQFNPIGGTAFYLLNPMFAAAVLGWVWALKEHPGQRVLRVTIPLLAIAHVCILCCHRTLGGWQFGNRYLTDILPWLFLGLLVWKPTSRRYEAAVYPMAAFGMAMQLVGAIATYNGWI